ncbi:MAG: hypothetical protein WCX16_00600 [Candidatus Omnitrophota bacterium]|jgi:hypothetical protein
MKRIVCLLFILSLTGCMFIVRDGEDIKSLGISKDKAKEEIAAIDTEAETFHLNDDSKQKDQ